MGYIKKELDLAHPVAEFILLLRSFCPSIRVLLPQGQTLHHNLNERLSSSSNVDYYYRALNLLDEAECFLLIFCCCLLCIQIFWA